MLPKKSTRLARITTVVATVLVGLLTVGSPSAAAPPDKVFDAHAYGAKITIPVGTVAPLAPADVTCTATPGSSTNQLASANLGLVSIGVTQTSASGTEDANGLDTATASANVASVRLLNGLVTADALTATATATDDATGAVTTTGTSTFTNLKVNGVAVANPAANTTITIPFIGTVVLNEQVATAGGDGISVNAVRVSIAGGIQIIAGHAAASLTDPGDPCPAP